MARGQQQHRVGHDGAHVDCDDDGDLHHAADVGLHPGHGLEGVAAGAHQEGVVDAGTCSMNV